VKHVFFSDTYESAVATTSM